MAEIHWESRPGYSGADTDRIGEPCPNQCGRSRCPGRAVCVECLEDALFKVRNPAAYWAAKAHEETMAAKTVEAN